MASRIHETIQKFNKPVVKRTVLTVVVIAIIVITFVFSAHNYSKAAGYRDSSAEVSAECEEIKEEISEKLDLIDGKGFDEYCEKIAREKYGYAKPGEYVIYDSSYGK